MQYTFISIYKMDVQVLQNFVDLLAFF